jgi:hypothetical protein
VVCGVDDVAIQHQRVARIGNSSGLRLPAAFCRDHPQFTGAAGQVEVLSDNTRFCAWSRQNRRTPMPRRTV